MSRKFLVLASAAVLAIALAGCSGGGSAPSQGSEAGSSAASEATSAAVEAAPAESDDGLLSGMAWPENETTEGVPVPQFSVGPVSVTEGDNQIYVRYEGVTEAEAAAYVDEVKAAGFTYNTNEMKSTESYVYNAYNSEEMFESTQVSITFEKDGRLSISVANFANALQ